MQIVVFEGLGHSQITSFFCFEMMRSLPCLLSFTLPYLYRQW